MKRLALLLSVLILVPKAFPQGTTQLQFFTGIVLSGTNDPSVAPSGSLITGSLIADPATFVLTNSDGPCPAAYFNVGGQLTYQASVVLNVSGVGFSVSDSAGATYGACDNLRVVNFADYSTFGVDCWPYAPFTDRGPNDFPLTVPPNCYVYLRVTIPGSGATTIQLDGTPFPKLLGHPKTCCGDPINIPTGNLFEEVTDYSTAGPNKLSFVRYYNTQADTSSFAHEFGFRWRSNFDRYIRILSSSSVVVERADGQELNFTLQNGVWIPDSDIDVTLTNSGPNWVLTDKNDTVETYATLNLASGATITYTEAKLQTIQSRNGYTQKLVYTGSQLTSVIDSNQRSLSFTYVGALMQTVTTPDGLVLTYGFTSSTSTSGGLDRLSSVTYSTSPQTSQSYLYENAALPLSLTGIIDENGNRYATWGYDGSGRVVSNYMGSGANAAETADNTTIAYDDTTGNRTVTNALAQPSVYSFTTLQGVPKVTQIVRQPTSTTKTATRTFTYDPNGYISTATDWNDNQTVFTNNAHGQPTSIVEASGSPVTRTTNISYDQTWVHLPHEIIAPGVTTDFAYDGNGNALTRTQTDTTTTTVQTRTWTFTWGNYGLLATSKGPRTDVDTTKHLYYDSNGALNKITNALQQSVQITNTPGGRPQTIVDANNVKTQLTYDLRQRLTSQAVSTAAGVLTTSFGYDPAGNLTGTTLPDGSTLTNSYDTAHRLTQVTDSLGNYVKYDPDGLGDRTGVSVYSSNAQSPSWQRSATFDALGRLLVNTAGAGQTTTQTYDSNGNILTAADGLNQTTTNTYDALNRLGTSTDANNAVTTPGYDAQDHVISVKDANGYTTSYVRDGFGEVIQQVSPDSGTTTFVYDADGNQTSKIDALKIVTNQTFDALDRPLTTTYPADPVENVSYTYDQTGTGFSYGTGRLTSVTDQAGLLARSYDERGNLTQETRLSGSKTLITGYSYDGASRVASMTYPDGTLVAYQHDAAGYLSNAAATLPGAAATQIAAFTHQPFGPIGTVTYGNGITEAWTFDQAYRATNLTDALSGANLQNLTYGYDLADNVKSITDAVNAANSQTFDYDPVNRLKDATSGPGGYGSLAWTYDPVGNRLTQTQGSVTTQYGYTAGTNRLLSITQTTTTAVIHVQRPARKKADMGLVVAIHGPPPTTLPVRATGPPRAGQPPSRAFMAVLGWPILLTGLLGAAGFRKRLLVNRFLALLTVTALLTGLTGVIIGCGNSLVSTPGSSTPTTGSNLNPAATPAFTPAAGTFSTAQTVTLSDSAAGASIYYTIDGTTPTAASTLYTAPIAVSSSQTIKAIAVAGGYSNSPVATASYTINLPVTLPVAATPIFSPIAGTFSGSQSITITDATQGAAVYYTTDGTTPTSGSTLYTGPITVSHTETLQAIATASGYSQSAIGSAIYTISPPVTAVPAFSPPAGAYTTVQTVTITDTTPYAAIYYTTDGSAPSAASTKYLAPIAVSTTQTISALAVASGQASSPAATALYQLPPRVAPPIITPPGGSFTSPQTVTISDATSGATITDNIGQGAYTGPITLGSTTTLSASARKDGYLDSPPASAQFFFAIPNNGAPVLSPAAETFNGSVLVSLTNTFAGATDYYTTDGSTPTISSQRYTGPIAVSWTETVSAISVTGTFISPVSSASYTLSSTTPSPTISPGAPNLYSAPITITLADANPQAVIYYTNKPDDPLAPGVTATYTGPFTVYETGYLTAYAVAPGYPQSATVSKRYIIGGQPSTPTLMPAGGTFVGQQTVAIADATPGTTIYYTTDGSAPTQSSTLYSAPVTVSTTETISAIAVDSALRTSDIAAAKYTVTAPPVVTVETNANGNITGIPPANGYTNATFGYNNANRLSTVIGSPVAASYLYDYAGQRFSKANPGTPPTIYSYAQGGTLIAENDNGTVTDYIYADGRPIAQIQPSATPAANQVSYVLTDQLGTPQRLVSSSGTTVWSTTYQPFGTTGTISATVNQNLRFPGQLADAETSFSYNLNRDYMPQLGRYLETDQLGLSGGINTYAYVEGNPYRSVDPKGQDDSDNLPFTPLSDPSVMNPNPNNDPGDILRPFGPDGQPTVQGPDPSVNKDILRVKCAEYGDLMVARAELQFLRAYKSAKDALTSFSGVLSEKKVTDKVKKAHDNDVPGKVSTARKDAKSLEQQIENLTILIKECECLNK